MPIAAERPPELLQIHREAIRPGQEAAYDAIEEDTARFQRRLGCPHPYLGIEALTGTKEAWFFNGYASLAESERVAQAYRDNAALMAALLPNGKRKAGLIVDPKSAFAEYRPEASSGVPWSPGRGRFLVITVTRNRRRVEGTVFETKDGTRYIIRPARTRADADAAATRAGPEANVYAVRPSWSFPAESWIALDPRFWRSSSSSKAK